MNQSEGNNSSLEESNWRETDKLDETNKKQEQRIRNLETKAIQNVNLYFIFQAVVLLASTTAAASSSSTTAAATCRRWWIPFTLSLLAAITNFLSLSTTVSAVLKSREELDQNLSDLASMKSNQTTRDPVSPGNIPQNIPSGDQIIDRPKADNFINKWKRRLVVYFLVGLFVGFSAVVMFGCYNILC